MKKEHRWFTVYPGSPKATNLAMAGGGAKLLSILIAVAAIPVTLALLATGIRLTMAGGGLSAALMFLVDEADDEMATAFFLWSAAAICRYMASVLSSKAALMGDGITPEGAAQEERSPGQI